MKKKRTGLHEERTDTVLSLVSILLLFALTLSATLGVLWILNDRQIVSFPTLFPDTRTTVPQTSSDEYDTVLSLLRGNGNNSEEATVGEISVFRLERGDYGKLRELLESSASPMAYMCDAEIVLRSGTKQRTKEIRFLRDGELWSAYRRDGASTVSYYCDGTTVSEAFSDGTSTVFNNTPSFFAEAVAGIPSTEQVLSLDDSQILRASYAEYQNTLCIWILTHDEDAGVWTEYLFSTASSFVLQSNTYLSDPDEGEVPVYTCTMREIRALTGEERNSLKTNTSK